MLTIVILSLNIVLMFFLIVLTVILLLNIVLLLFFMVLIDIVSYADMLHRSPFETQCEFVDFHIFDQDTDTSAFSDNEMRRLREYTFFSSKYIEKGKL